MERIVPGEYQEWNWNQMEYPGSDHGKPPKPPTHSHRNELYNQIPPISTNQKSRPVPSTNQNPAYNHHVIQPSTSTNNSISVIDKKGKYTRHRPAPLDIGSHNHNIEAHSDQRVPSLPSYPTSETQSGTTHVTQSLL